MRQVTVEPGQVRRFREALAAPGAPAAPDGHVPVTFPVLWWGNAEGFGQGAIIHADQEFVYPGGPLRVALTYRLHSELPAAAAAAGLPATIAHGMFTMGLLGELAACWVDNTGWVAHLFVRFRGIVPSGTELRGVGVTAPLLDGRPGRLLYLAAVTGRGEVVTTGVAEVQTHSSGREGTT